MIIDDPDAFKTWLTAVLKPICEADPDALAKYVIALVKKDKSHDALRQSMINQLEVFLQQETEPFVNQLFKTLDTQDYITPVIPNANPPNPNIIKASEAPAAQQQQQQQNKAVLPKTVIPVSEIAANLNETLNGKGLINNNKDNNTKNEDKQLNRRRSSRHRSLSRNRSRSRSWDRTRRSRSREKSRERDKRDRVRSWRNKSPPRRYERRRSLSAGRGRSRSRSPRHNYRGRYRNRSPPRSSSRSRSRSPERRDRKDNQSGKETSGAATPTQDSGNLPADMDLRSAQSVQSAIVQPTNSSSQPSNKRRCRDYDEKGFCMRGEMCPYDHGVDPVVLEDSALSRVLYAPNGAGDGILGPPPVNNPLMHMRPTIPTEYNPQAPQMWHHRPPGGFRGHGHGRGGINPSPRFQVQPPIGGFPPGAPNLNVQQRELISVPVMDSSGGAGVPPPGSDNYNYNNQVPGGGAPSLNFHHSKQRQFDFNRLGPRQKDTTNCSLLLRKVPTGLNNITQLNNHFAKFGRIVNIQVYFDGDPEAAIVTFSSHASANSAFRSTEAVLNNRFIKVFWHQNNDASGALGAKGGPDAAGGKSVKDRLGQATNVFKLNSLHNNATTLIKADKENTNTTEEGVVAENNNEKMKDADEIKKEEKAQAALAIKKNQELLAAKEKLKKNQEEKRKEAIKLTQDLRKRKQELLEKQLAQQKLLIEKMEKAPAGAQRDLLLQTIKKSQESIEAIRKDLSQSVLTMKTPAIAGGGVRKTKEEAQKEMLDAELDLISKQAEGADTSELQRKIAELRARAVVISSRGGGRGRGASSGSAATRRFHPHNRHLLTKNNLIDQATSGKKGATPAAAQSPVKSHTIDHRPTKILISGYESDEQESVLSHFAQFGEIVDYVVDAATPSIIVNYKLRKEAEIAITKGRHFQDRTLSVTWCNNTQLNNQLTSRTVLISESDEDNLIDYNLHSPVYGPDLPEDVLLQDDEEEEEENEEDRSWRR